MAIFGVRCICHSLFWLVNITSENTRAQYFSPRNQQDSCNLYLVFDDFKQYFDISILIEHSSSPSSIICMKTSSTPLPAQRDRLPGHPSELLDFGHNLPEKVKFGSSLHLFPRMMTKRDVQAQAKV